MLERFVLAALVAGTLFPANGVAQPATLRYLTATAADEEHPVWSKDGRQLAFQREADGWGIWIVGLDGRGERRLTPGDRECKQPSWSPDGKTIACRVRDQGGWNLALIDVKTGHLREIATPGDAKHPSWSPDGKTIVYYGELPGHAANLYALSVAHPEHPRQLTSDEAWSEVHPSYSPDGRTIVFHAYPGNRAEDDDEAGDTRLGVIDANGGARRWLDTGALGDPKHPFFSVSHLITFHADDTAGRNVYAMAIDAAHAPVALTNVKNAKHPQLSPDGRHLAFAIKRRLTAEGHKEWDLAVVAIDVARLRQRLKGPGATP